MSDSEAQILRHFLAALAYRTQKAVRGAPVEFGDFEAGNLVRSPKEIVRHMTSVLGYARGMFRGAGDRPQPLSTLEAELERFHAVLVDLSRHLEAGDEPVGVTLTQLLQGPFSDAMTHAGQLAMLRRLHGTPVSPENFVLADIDVSNVGAMQPDPRAPAEGWSDDLS